MLILNNNKIIITDNKILDKKEISTNNILRNSDFQSYINIIYDNYKKINTNFSGDEDSTLFNLKRNDDIFKLINNDKYVDDIGDAKLKLENIKLFDCKKKTLYDVSTDFFTNLFLAMKE